MLQFTPLKVSISLAFLIIDVGGWALLRLLILPYAPGRRFRVGGRRKMVVFGSSQHEPLPPPLRTLTSYAPGWRFRVGGPRKWASSALRNMILGSKL